MRNFQDADLTHSTQPSTHGGYRRQSVMKALMHAELQDIDVLEKEAVFQYLKRGRHGKNSGPLFGNNLAALRAMPEVAAIHEDLKDTVSHEKDSPDRHLSGFRVRKAVRWVDKPIAHVSAELKDRFPEFEGVHEEFQQARLQLRTLRFTSDDLGQDAGLFHLRNIAAFLEYVCLNREWTDRLTPSRLQLVPQRYGDYGLHTKGNFAGAVRAREVAYTSVACSSSQPG